MSLTDAAAKALRSLGTPGMFWVIFSTILVALFCLVGFVIGFSSLMFYISLHIHNFLAYVITWGGSIGSVIMAWMLFPGIMPVFVSFFGDKVASLIDAHDYAHIPVPPKDPAGFWQEVLHDVGFSFKAIALNIMCMPLYLIPLVNLGIFYMLNGYLLGREFFMMSARRYMPAAEAENLRGMHALTLLMAGMLLTFLATIPIINLIAPFWGVALATHLFHQVYEKGKLPLVTVQRGDS